MKLAFTGRIARAAATRPLVTIGVWVAVLAAAFVMAGRLGDVVTQDDEALVETESDTAAALVEQYLGVDAPQEEIELAIVIGESATYGTVEFDAAIDAVVAAVADVDGVAAVTLPGDSEPPAVAASGDSALISIVVEPDEFGDYEEVGAALLSAYDTLDLSGFTVLPFGNATGEVSIDELAAQTLLVGEAIGIGVALVILVVVFGAVVAAGLPIGVAIVSIVTAVGMAAIVGNFFDLSFFVVNMISMMGLALGIDYSLIAVQRFREELAKGRSALDAVTITGSTANRAVLFSGMTVLIALSGLLVVRSTVMVSLGTGAMLVAIASVASALTLLPAVLRLLGHRVNGGRIPTAHPGQEPRRWAAVARGVLSRPIAAAAAGLVLLATLAVPALSMRLAFPGLDSLPEDNEFRQAQQVLVDDFGYGRSSTVVAIENADGAQSQIDDLAARIDATDAYAETTVVTVDGTAFIQTENVYDSADERADDAVRLLRDELVPNALAGTDAVAYVGGDQAGSLDFAGLIIGAAPIVLAVVLGASFLLLLVTFRSIVIPAVAITLNMVSTAAAFGLLVAAFQWGWGGWLGLSQVDAIAPWIPLFLFAVLFGLSMDYHVFLLSRIKESYDFDGDTRRAIVVGLSRTGSLITGAALIMVAVFAGFALGDLAEFAQMGFGLAAAIIIDATVVRTLLVPSVMALLGKANWYLPKWLDWLPEMRIEGGEPADANGASSGTSTERVLAPA